MNQQVVETVNAQVESTPVVILDDTNYNVLLRIVEAEASGKGGCVAGPQKSSRRLVSQPF